MHYKFKNWRAAEKLVLETTQLAKSSNDFNKVPLKEPISIGCP